MLYDAKTPSEYMEMLEDDWRKEKLQQIRRMILSSGPDLDEVISYKMLGYKDERGIVFHLNAQKDYVSFYVGDAKKVDPEGRYIKGIDMGKGCLRFKKSLSVFDTQIDKFIEIALKKWRAGEDIDC